MSCIPIQVFQFQNSIGSTDETIKVTECSKFGLYELRLDIFILKEHGLSERSLLPKPQDT